MMSILGIWNRPSLQVGVEFIVIIRHDIILITNQCQLSFKTRYTHYLFSIWLGVFLERTPQLLFENLERFVYFFTKPTQYFPVPLLEPLS